MATKQNSPTSLSGRIVIVTGGGAGIGLGVVKAVTAAGARAVVAEKNSALAQRVAELDLDTDFIETDVGNPESISRLFQTVSDRYGRLDGLVNNAGLTVTGDFLDFPLESIELLWSVNLRGSLLCAQQAGRLMRAGRSGVIVNIASNHAFATAPGFEMYAATKGGLAAMTRGMAWSLGRYNIRVNAVCPGLTHTEVNDAEVKANPDLAGIYAGWHATGRYNQPVDVGEIVAFLLSDASVAITGANVVADNGMSSLLYSISK